MGRSKAELFLAGVAAAASRVFEGVIAVERPAGEQRDIETIFEEPHDDDGPIYGIARALAHAGGRCFVLAVDLPLIQPAVLAELRRRFERSDAPMLVPVWEGAPQVLCAGYAPEALPLIERRIASGRLSLRRLLEEAGAELVPEDDLRALFPGEPLMNVNTPAELAAAQRMK